MLALSGSTTNRPFSSSRHRYRPVVMWRIRNDCPHFMWLPLQLQAQILLSRWADWSLMLCYSCYKHWTIWMPSFVNGSPNSERLQPPQRTGLAAHRSAFVVGHPGEESGKWSVVVEHQIKRFKLVCFLPALFLSFLWGSNSQTLIHVAVEQPENVASGEKAWGFTYS